MHRHGNLLSAALAACVSMMGAIPGGAVRAGTIGAQTPTFAERLHNVGSLIFDRFGHQVQLRGFNADNDSVGFDPLDGVSLMERDANTVKAMGGNVERWTPAWYKGGKRGDTCGSWPQTGDAYNPPAPAGSGSPDNGYFGADVLAQTDALVQAATSRQIWVILGITTGGCDFATPVSGGVQEPWNHAANANPTFQGTVDAILNTGQYKAMWAFLAKRYKDTPYIACYELWTEPTPRTGDDGSRYLNEVVAYIDAGAIAAIRGVDPITPICVGPAANYDVRSNFDMTAYFAPILNSNVWNMNDWYELAGVDNSGTFLGYTHQLKPLPGAAPPVNGPNFMGSILGTMLSVPVPPTAPPIVVGTILRDSTHGVGSGVAPATVIVSGSGSSFTVDPPQTVPSENMFTGYTTYPDWYYDQRSSAAAPYQSSVCLYPPNYSTGAFWVQMDASFLQGLDDACAVAWSNQTGVPILMEQIGVATATPGAWKYDRIS